MKIRGSFMYDMSNSELTSNGNAWDELKVEVNSENELHSFIHSFVH